MSPDTKVGPAAQQPTLDAARARARAIEHTQELPADHRSKRPSLKLLAIGLAAAAAGFGLGFAVSDDDPATTITVDKAAPPPPTMAIDPSTVPRPVGPARTVTADDGQ
jgi:hypothetical protein